MPVLVSQFQDGLGLPRLVVCPVQLIKEYLGRVRSQPDVHDPVRAFICSRHFDLPLVDDAAAGMKIAQRST
ncbi:MAG: hypothetical protein JWM48_1434 [Mycobacterium sp.]|nr:hypothetical protein [Mycobacterium sp.]